MRIELFQHVPFEGPGIISAWASAAGHKLNIRHLYRDPPIADLSESAGLIVMGGPMGATEETLYAWMTAEKRAVERALQAKIPVLGICLGAQIIADVLGSKVYANPEREIGWFPVTGNSQNARAKKLFPSNLTPLHWHGDTFDLPEGCERLCSTAVCTNQAFAADNILGLQFHLEMTLDSVSSLIAESKKDFEKPGAYVQSPDEITSNRKRFDTANSQMISVLDTFFS